MKMNILNVGRLFLLAVVLILSWQQARASITGVHSISLTDNGVECVNQGYYAQTVPWGDPVAVAALNAGGACTLSSSNYVPHSGMYKVELKFLQDQGGRPSILVLDVSTNPVFVDGTKSIDQQSIVVTGSAASKNVPRGSKYYGCQYLVDENDNKYLISATESASQACAPQAEPLPPTPVVPDTSCTLNDGNALNVNLNNVDRSQMPTVPGSGSMRHIQVPVECTGGDVTVNMQLNYTPISLSAGEVIKSSSNGLGVSVVYDSKILSSTDITPVTFLAGSNSIDLAFQAVRDPTVEIKDVPTGAFTASAVLVMTQQ